MRSVMVEVCELVRGEGCDGGGVKGEECDGGGV